MRASKSLRLLIVALVTVLVMLAAFKLEFHLRFHQELERLKCPVTRAEDINVLPGFKVQLVYYSTNQGSWSCMTRDAEGRLIISPEDKGPLVRVTVNHGKVGKVGPLSLSVGSAMGILCAEGWLFIDGAGPKGWGIYRLRVEGDGFAEPEFLRPMTDRGEHGSHAIVMGPDHKLYIVSGDYTKVPPDIQSTSPLQNYADDQLLPRAEDGRGFGVGLKPPGGFVIRMDLDGRNCELIGAGTRNIYDIAFSADGELFGFDNDPEMDHGTAWYRPIRINHWISGGDYGYRQGAGKLPDYYEDTLPATLNVGIGAPSGIMFATESNFPKPYRDACFMEDWTYGRLFAVHFIPRGATYDAVIETVLRGQPLNLSGLQVGLDGDLYLITGGRQSVPALYRLSYGGPELREPQKTKEREAGDIAGFDARALRRKLETLQGRRDPGAIDFLWANLDSRDRWIRYAARVALEFQDIAWWKDRALTETNVEGGLTALLALARCGGPETQRDLLAALEKFPFSRLTRQQTLLKFRVMELSFIRQGRPSDDLARHAIDTLDALYPADDEDFNEELCQLLLYLRAPDAVAKTVGLLDKAPTQEEQTYYVMRLRDITNGWTLPLRRDYLGWFQKDHDHAHHRADIAQYFHDVGLPFRQGPSFVYFMDQFLAEAFATLSLSEKTALAAYMPKPPIVPKSAHGGKFVKQWRMADLEPDLRFLDRRRSHARGMACFKEVGCALCHRFGDHGGSVGPDLTAVGSRLNARGILESILEPSKVLPEQYQNTILTTREGDDLTGRVLKENDESIVFMTDLIHPASVTIDKKDILSRRISKVSPMPEGMVNSLREDEIWDLISCLQSGAATALAPATNKAAEEHR